MGQFDGNFEVSVSELESIKDEKELRDFLSRLLARYDLQNAVYHGVRLPGIANPNSVLILTYPQQWINRYVEQDYFNSDPVVQAGNTSLLPVDWDTLDKRGPKSLQMFSEANDIGIGTQGLTFPIRGPQGEHALFTITTKLNDRSWQILKRTYMRDFQMLAHFVHGKVLEFEFGAESMTVQKLSPRERELLTRAALGESDKVIAAKTGLKPRSVRWHLDCARHKLNCLNRAHAVTKAISLRLIGPASE